MDRSIEKKLDEDDMKYIAYLKNEINALTVLNQVRLIKKMLIK